MGGVVSSISSIVGLGLTYCVCNSASSLCGACLGGTDPSTTGRKRSVMLLAITVALALLFQFYVAPGIVHNASWWKIYRELPGFGKLAYSSWTDGCHKFDEGGLLYLQCVQNSGVYRPTAVATVFFVLCAVATKTRPAFNREVWPAKLAIFLFAVIVAGFIPNTPFLSGIYLLLARIGAAIFLVMQQIILIDVAYNWNESWVAKADEADRIDGYGSGVGWLRLIVATCIGLYVLTMTGIGYLYHHFEGCPENNVVITFTLIGVVAVTIIQLSGSEGSLLTSAVICIYATYLAFSAVSRNPLAHCNPHMGHNDLWGIVVGLALTALSLAWTGWCYTAEGRLNPEGIATTKTVTPSTTSTQNASDLNLDVPFLDPEDTPMSGVVMETSEFEESSTTGASSDLWKLNVILALISCWVACMLTGWGSLEDYEDRTAANPQVGRVNMFMIAFSQWIALCLYGWTLVAPRLFPDRDFS